ncbi:MAG TPA: AI-2E family transporter [Myxococcota bacterium]|nr:AI-2E family transporter [Myxococcota bacterium]
MSAMDRRFELVISGAALVLLLLGCAVVLRPFFTSLLWAIILWLATASIHQRVHSWVGERRTAAALLMTLGIAAVLLLPIVVVGFSVADSVGDLGTAANRWLEAGPPQPPAWLHSIPLIGKYVTREWIALAGDTERLREVGQSLIERGSTSLLAVGGAVVRGGTEIAVSILIAFFLYRDRVAFGDRFRAAAARIAGPSADPLIDLAVGTLHSVVYGILGTAVAQGVMAGVGLLIARVPGAVVLGMITFFLSIVPMGPPLVWVPATVWLYQSGEPGWALFMLIWGFGVSSIDNFLKPWLISQGSTLPFILIFFGVIGGVLAFGFIGIFLGPTLLAVGYRLVLDWAVVVRGQAPAEVPAASA